MKIILNFKGLLFFILLVFLVTSAYTDITKWVNVGKLHTKIVDSGTQHAAAPRPRLVYYYNKFANNRTLSFRHGLSLGTSNWTDEHGILWSVKTVGSGFAGGTGMNETVDLMPLKDKNELTIHRYRKYKPPIITVEGLQVNDPFPFDDADEINPDKIPGTADIMVESWISTQMGVTIHNKVLAWSQKNHDDYIVWDWRFINTGNVNFDDEIELPNQTLNNLYLFRSNRLDPAHPCWCSCYGEYPSDSLRMVYAYPHRSEGSSYDNFGQPNQTSGWLDRPWYCGEITLFAPNPNNPSQDDPSQPQMTGYHNSESPFTRNGGSYLGGADALKLYEAMQYGTSLMEGTPLIPDAFPNTYHEVRLDERGYKFTNEASWFAYDNINIRSYGPYTLPFGDSLRFVWAFVGGTISPEKAWEVGKAWINGTATPPPGMAFGVQDNLPPAHQLYPDLYNNDPNDWAKDCWVATGKDSLFRNATNAVWNFNNNFNIPVPPPAPSIEVQGLPDRIHITWDNISEQDGDFAGYRVYRAVGDVDTTYFPIFACGEGTGNALVHEYEDTDAQRGIAYYYYVAAFDDGVGNNVGALGKKEVLESGKYLNRTPRPTFLSRAPGESLEDIVVVPNPYNYSARFIQFTGEPNKIMFLNLPLECTIRIFSESGDLVKTIEHYGSGDASWGILEDEHSVSDSGQRIVSGIYVAHIETPEGNAKILKFLVVR
jgi:hypothetical protein